MDRGVSSQNARPVPTWTRQENATMFPGRRDQVLGLGNRHPTRSRCGSRQYHQPIFCPCFLYHRPLFFSRRKSSRSPTVFTLHLYTGVLGTKHPDAAKKATHLSSLSCQQPAIHLPKLTPVELFTVSIALPIPYSENCTRLAIYHCRFLVIGCHTPRTTSQEPLPAAQTTPTRADPVKVSPAENSGEV
jgi:hypothetical protein